MVEFGRVSITSSTHARPAANSSSGLRSACIDIETHILGVMPVAAAQHESDTAVVQNSRLTSSAWIAPRMAHLCFIRTWRASRSESSAVRIGSPAVQSIRNSFICSTTVEWTIMSIVRPKNPFVSLCIHWSLTRLP
jgi:hypothetical protein